MSKPSTSPIDIIAMLRSWQYNSNRFRRFRRYKSIKCHMSQKRGTRYVGHTRFALYPMYYAIRANLKPQKLCIAREYHMCSKPQLRQPLIEKGYCIGLIIL